YAVRKLATAESLAGLVGLGFVALGVVGFAPGVVQGYGGLVWWKSGSGAQLFDLFQTSILLNLVHMGFGVAGLLAARRWPSARAYLTGGGALLRARDLRAAGRLRQRLELPALRPRRRLAAHRARDRNALHRACRQPDRPPAGDLLLTRDALEQLEGLAK